MIYYVLFSYSGEVLYGGLDLYEAEKMGCGYVIPIESSKTVTEAIGKARLEFYKILKETKETSCNLKKEKESIKLARSKVYADGNYEEKSYYDLPLNIETRNRNYEIISKETGMRVDMIKLLVRETELDLQAILDNNQLL